MTTYTNTQLKNVYGFIISLYISIGIYLQRHVVWAENIQYMTKYYMHMLVFINSINHTVHYD